MEIKWIALFDIVFENSMNEFMHEQKSWQSSQIVNLLVQAPSSSLSQERVCSKVAQRTGQRTLELK